MSRETALEEITERIHDLHELSFHYIEEKNKGAEVVSMESYEYLINHYIEYIQDLRDGVIEHGNKVLCSKCLTEMKGGESTEKA